MPIIVQTVRIAGFRGLANLEWNLGRRIVLIGPNNAGKTSALKALQLALGDSRFVGEEDFHVDANGKVADQIVVDVRIVPTDDKGEVTRNFDRQWRGEFRKDVQLDPGGLGQEALMFRVRIQRTDEQKRYYPERHLIKLWPKREEWLGDGHLEQTKFSGSKLAELLPFYFQDAQRDIMEDARQRHSFLGRVLAKVGYRDDDLDALQGLIDQLNKEAVDKSSVLATLQTQLSELGRAVANSGTAEISPVAKSVRDLTKGLRLNYAEAGNSFGMEYHGMGTRSWASLLVLKAFATIVQSERTNKPFLPFLALEEPEAHLHPNAQRQVYSQMSSFPGQVVVSTHSPYVAAQCQLKELRTFSRDGANVEVRALPGELSVDDERTVRRRVIETRGEILFARLVVLSEGETEEQALPVFFEKDNGCAAHDAGVCFVGVGGAGGYEPFLKVLNSLGIGWMIFSDGEVEPLKKLDAALKKVGSSRIDGRVVVIPNGDCFESYLVANGYADALAKAIDTIDGAGAAERWAATKDGKMSRPKKTTDTCPQCQQSIYQSVVRDYAGDEGRRRALLDQLMGGKTKYAAAVAREILELGAERQFPPIIRTLLDEIRARLKA